MSALSPLADDATREQCALCGREIVRARLDGGPRIWLDPRELDHPEGDVESARDVVLLTAAGQAYLGDACLGDARHTLHRCAQGGEAA